MNTKLITAEEWAHEWWDCGFEVLTERLRSVQLNAAKWGMEQVLDNRSATLSVAQMTAILTAAEKLELPK